MFKRYKKFIKNVALFLICIFFIFGAVYGVISVVFFENPFFSLFFVFYGVFSYIIDGFRLLKDLMND